jgi:crotonobetaine/carnitine-CoA ligase
MALDRQLTLPRLLRRRSREKPHKVFLQQVEGERALTYSQAHAEALLWADAFRRLGVGKQDTVISMLPVGFDAVHCWLGLNWLVAWEVPVNTMYQGRMLSYMLENSQAKVAVVGERYLDRLAAAAPEVGRIDTVIVPDANGPLPRLPFRMLTRAQFLDGAAPTDDHDGPEPWDVTEIFYTSGTTGPSKGVLYSHTQMHASTEMTSEFYTAEDCFYGPFPMYHVSGKNFVYSTLLADMRLVIREQFKTDLFWTDIKRYGCTATLLLGAMANFVYRQPVHPDEIGSPLNKVLMVPLIPELQQFKERFRCRVNTVFNMTEISSPIFGSFDDTDAMPANSCGRVREGYECRVVDENDIEVPLGELGELVVRSREPWRLNSGYFNMPEKTAEAWRNGWFHTGDGFTRDADGWFYFVDRKKDAIRRRGENISSVEVEAAVNDHPAVLESAAVAVPSEWGEDEVKVVVVCKPGATLTHEGLAEFLINTMPRFMVPRYIEFVDQLPKTPTEKVRKVELRESGVNARTWDRLAAQGRG